MGGISKGNDNLQIWDDITNFTNLRPVHATLLGGRGRPKKAGRSNERGEKEMRDEDMNLHHKEESIACGRIGLQSFIYTFHLAV